MDIAAAIAKNPSNYIVCASGIVFKISCTFAIPTLLKFLRRIFQNRAAEMRAPKSRSNHKKAEKAEKAEMRQAKSRNGRYDGQGGYIGAGSESEADRCGI